MERVTALEHTCVLVTPSGLVNEAFRAAKDNESNDTNTVP